jgi:uncharacterized protein HemX
MREDSSMALHTPAQQPVHHVHISLPHVGDAATGVLEALLAIVLVLAIGIVVSLVVTPSKLTPTEQARALAAFRASERAEYVLPESQALARFRASERAEYVLPAAQQMAQFRLEEHGY